MKAIYTLGKKLWDGLRNLRRHHTAVQHELLAWLPPCVMKSKLRGLVASLAGRVVHVSSGTVRMRFGRRRLVPLRRMGVDFPLELTLTLVPARVVSDAVTHRVVARFCPLSRRVAPVLVEERTKHLVRALRQWLMCHEQQRYYPGPTRGRFGE